VSYEEEEDTCFGLCMRCACEVALKPHVRVRIHVSYEEEDTCPCVSLSYPYSYPPPRTSKPFFVKVPPPPPKVAFAPYVCFPDLPLIIPPTPSR
jgi:hypothetical protein